MNYSVTSNSEQFIREMTDDKNKICGILRESANMDCFRQDQVMKDRLDEAINSLEKMDVAASPEKAVEDMLLFHKLVQEVQSND